MPFSSLNFLFLVIPVVVLYWLTPPRFQHFWLLISGVVVYAYAGWKDLLLLVAITGINWLSHRAFPQSKMARKGMIIANIGVLLWFKYRLFIGGIFGYHSAVPLVIPLGISFYIFQLISYQVELLRNIISQLPKFRTFFLYIFFFPHHQAGPIMRPSQFLLCFEKPRNFYRSDLIAGLMILAWGLVKKVYIADVIARIADPAYASFHASGGQTGNLPLMAVAYGIQIYADFSGYSDVAIGLGRLFGFRLDRNFHQPYTAQGPSMFWRRWHITLSEWLRDHIYIPLGGNRVGALRSLLNLVIVMVIGGLWHGAGWCFLLWGFIHGLLLLFEKLSHGRTFGLPAWMRYVGFQAVIMLTWLPFRESDLSSLWHGAWRMNAWLGQGTLLAAVLFAFILLFSHLEQSLETRFSRMLRWIGRKPHLAFSLAYAFGIYCVMLGMGHATSFIYQRF